MEYGVTSIHPRHIQRNDQFYSPEGFWAWTALEPAVTRTDETIHCEVQFADGGIGERVWSALDPEMRIVVRRRQ